MRVSPGWLGDPPVDPLGQLALDSRACSSSTIDWPKDAGSSPPRPARSGTARRRADPRETVELGRIEPDDLVLDIDVEPHRALVGPVAGLALGHLIGVPGDLDADHRLAGGGDGRAEPAGTAARAFCQSWLISSSSSRS